MKDLGFWERFFFLSVNDLYLFNQTLSDTLNVVLRAYVALISTYTLCKSLPEEGEEDFEITMGLRPIVMLNNRVKLCTHT